MSTQVKEQPSRSEAKNYKGSRVGSQIGSPVIRSFQNGQLILFQDRMTYTFTRGKEVDSIHFDGGRDEIFYKGHNVRNMELEDWQVQAMEKLRRILAYDDCGRPFSVSYGRVLDKVILEKRNMERSNGRKDPPKKV